MVFCLSEEGDECVDSCEACGGVVVSEGNVEVCASEDASMRREVCWLEQGQLAMQVCRGEGC